MNQWIHRSIIFIYLSCPVALLFCRQVGIGTVLDCTVLEGEERERPPAAHRVIDSCPQARPATKQGEGLGAAQEGVCVCMGGEDGGLDSRGRERRRRLSGAGTGREGGSGRPRSDRYPTDERCAHPCLDVVAAASSAAAAAPAACASAASASAAVVVVAVVVVVVSWSSSRGGCGGWLGCVARFLARSRGRWCE